MDGFPAAVRLDILQLLSGRFFPISKNASGIRGLGRDTVYVNHTYVKEFSTNSRDYRICFKRYRGPPHRLNDTLVFTDI